MLFKRISKFFRGLPEGCMGGIAGEAYK
nr:hypothetical protein [Takakia lepidozioides]